jgi:hypothetical protein
MEVKKNLIKTTSHLCGVIMFYIPEGLTHTNFQ